MLIQTRFYQAVSHDNLNVVKSVISDGADVDYNSVRIAILQKKLDILKYLIQISPNKHLVDYAMTTAITNDNLEVTKFLISTGVKCDNSTIQEASRFRNWRLVKYLLKLGLYSDNVQLFCDDIYDLFYEGYYDLVKTLLDNKKYYDTAQQQPYIKILQKEVDNIINNKIINKIYKIKAYEDLIIKIN